VRKYITDKTSGKSSDDWYIKCAFLPSCPVYTWDQPSIMFFFF
jgi:hypothetical protein